MSWIEGEAIVLRHVKQGDTSRVVTLFSRHAGKVAAMAKGSRRPGSRFGAALDLFTLSRIRYRARPNRDLVYLDSCELTRSFEPLARDVTGYGAASACVELVNRIVPDGARSEEVFDHLLASIGALSETSPLPVGEETRAVAVATVFQAKLMDTLGIAPELTACVACGEATEDGSPAFSPARGGLLCRRCRREGGARRLGPAALEILRRAAFSEVSWPLTAASSPGTGALREARAALDAVLQHHHGEGTSLRSLRFLDSIGES